MQTGWEKFLTNYRNLMKRIAGIWMVIVMGVLFLSSCRSQYYFPGGNARKRRPPKDCGCPSYAMMDSAYVQKEGQSFLSTSVPFQGIDLDHEMQAAEISCSDFAGDSEWWFHLDDGVDIAFQFYMFSNRQVLDHAAAGLLP